MPGAHHEDPKFRLHGFNGDSRETGMQSDLAPETLILLEQRAGTMQLSRGRTSLVTRINGSIDTEQPSQGLYVYDTRLLSRYRWRLDGKEPALSASSNIEQFSSLTYYIHAPERCKEAPPHECDPLEQTIELRIGRAVGEGLHEDVCLTNHTQDFAPVLLELDFDITFESRVEAEKGHKQHGDLQIIQSEPRLGVWELMAHYRADHYFNRQGNEGVAHIDRGLRLRVQNADSTPRISKHGLSCEAVLAPHQQWHMYLNWIVYVDGHQLPLPTRRSHVAATAWTRRRTKYLREVTSFRFRQTGTLSSTVENVLRRSTLDMEALRLNDLGFGGNPQTLSEGIALAAGIPTYQGVFGRDMEASAWQAVMLTPEFLRGALNCLNRLSAQEVNDWRDAQPGRLPHEIHTDPVSVFNFNPKGLYFGGVTSSFLFPILVTELFHWTGELNEVRKYVDTAMGAIRWADTYCLDFTGFYRYKTRSEQGMKNQGWKDSGDAIVYPDGSQVEPPIGTCEMQAFMYAAKVRFSELLFRLGHLEAARKLYTEAEDLKTRFNETFWMEDEGYVALGIDPEGNPIRSIASDPGLCILAGILDASRVKKVAARMMQKDLFTGWGIRTLSADHPAFNPFAYHRGSVWPVTTSAFVMAFSRYSLVDEMNQLARALFEAAALFENDRLPEVFGGHQRTAETPFPGLYTRADIPQAWSASAPFTMICAMLGIHPYAPDGVLFLDPHLPEWLPEITVEGLQVGSARISLRFVRTPSGETDYQVLDLNGSLQVIRVANPWSLTSGWVENITDAVQSLLPRGRKI